MTSTSSSLTGNLSAFSYRICLLFCLLFCCSVLPSPSASPNKRKTAPNENEEDLEPECPSKHFKVDDVVSSTNTSSRSTVSKVAPIPLSPLLPTLTTLTCVVGKLNSYSFLWLCSVRTKNSKVLSH